MVSKVFLDVGVEALKTKTKIILGSFRTNVFLVSHIRVGGKYNFLWGADAGRASTIAG